MIKNYLKIAWRNIVKNKWYSIINIVGMTLSLTVLMLIMLYVKDDLSFDKMHANGNNIYRLVQDRDQGEGKISKMGNTGYPQGEAFKNELSYFNSYCRFKNGWNTLVKKGNEGLLEDLKYVDSSFFDIFSYKTIEGNTNQVFQNLNNVVITDRVASKYFGKENALGKTLSIGDEGSEFKPFVVSAVVKHPPKNSSIQFDLLLSIENIISKDSIQRINDSNWFNASLNTFMLVHEGTNIAALEKKMTSVTSKYHDKSNNSKPPVFHLQPLYKMHLDPEYYATNGLEMWSDEKYPRILTILGIIILIIASINFINLSLAQSIKRIKEIGIRKTVGGTTSQLVIQFLIEAIMITILSFLPSLLLAKSLLPSFCSLTNKFLDSSVLFQKESMLLYFCLLILVVIVAGLYPALILSKFKPIESLKGKFVAPNRSSLDKTFIVFQFAVAGVLIICTIISNKQLIYITSADLGYKTENIIRFWLPWEQIAKINKPFKDEISKLPYVKNVSSKSGDWNSSSFLINGKNTGYVYYEDIDENHLQLMGLTLTKGRFLSSKFGLDTVSSVVVNESFVRENIPPGTDPFEALLKSGEQKFYIVGIIKDFHYASFKEKIKPILWFLDRGGQAGCIHIELDGNNKEKAIASIQAIYKKYVPYLPMEYQFLQDFRMQKYEEEILWKKIFQYSSIISILIACLGLLGIVMFITERKTKEIGIRKVMGASITNVVMLMSKQFLMLVFIGLIIAIPVAYYLSNKQFEDLVYREKMEWWIYLFGSVLVMAISFATVCIQSLKAALANPVKSLGIE